MKSNFFYGESVPMGPVLLDGINRRIRFTHKGFRFEADDRPVVDVDLEWPIRLETI